MMWEVHSLGYVTSQTVLALIRIQDLPRIPEIYRKYRITGLGCAKIQEKEQLYDGIAQKTIQWW